MDQRTKQALAESTLQRDAEDAVLRAAGALLARGDVDTATAMAKNKLTIACELLDGLGRHWRFIGRPAGQVTVNR
jgi:hypothetical protein